MNNWNEVEKQRRATKFTKQDEMYEYFKISVMFFIGYLYFHFVIMGWHL